MLPAHGEVTDLSPRSREKLGSLSRVLRAADRDGIYVFKIVDVPQAAVGNYFRTAVLVTKPALNLLDGYELQALVAHELAHEYVWQDHQEAVTRRDGRRLRELELVADVVAVLTLWKAGMDPAMLPRAIDKVGQFNRVRFGVAANEGSYPAANERRRLVEALAAVLSSARWRSSHVGGGTADPASGLQWSTDQLCPSTTSGTRTPSSTASTSRSTRTRTAMASAISRD